MDPHPYVFSWNRVKHNTCVLIGIGTIVFAGWMLVQAIMP